MEEIEKIKKHTNRLKDEYNTLLSYGDGIQKEIDIKEIELEILNEKNQTKRDELLKTKEGMQLLLQVDKTPVVVKEVVKEINKDEVLDELKEIVTYTDRKKEEYNELLSYGEGIKVQTEIEENKLNKVKLISLGINKNITNNIIEADKKFNDLKEESKDYVNSIVNKNKSLDDRELDLEKGEVAIEELKDNLKLRIVESDKLKYEINKDRLELGEKLSEVNQRISALDIKISRKEKEIVKYNDLNKDVIDKQETLNMEFKTLHNNKLKIEQTIESMDSKYYYLMNEEQRLSKERLKLIDERQTLNRAKAEIYSKKYGRI